MYLKKNILYVLDYDFENGQPIKPRYFVILDDAEKDALILSVVTSQDHVPDSLIQHG